MKKSVKQGRDIRSFEADEDISDLLDLACEATGKTLKEIVNEAIRRHLPEVVAQAEARRAESLRRFRDAVTSRLHVPIPVNLSSSEALRVAAASMDDAEELSHQLPGSPPRRAADGPTVRRPRPGRAASPET